MNATISEHPQVREFITTYNHAFTGVNGSYDDYLNTTLIKGWETVNRNQIEADLSEELFKRLAPIALVDKYQAYQYQNNQWQIISGDLEMMQTEGFDATKEVEANMVIKKQKDKDVEVQDANTPWKGHILPFDLIQQTHLSDDVKALADQEARLTEIASELEETLESLTEDDKEQTTVKESKDGFVNAEVGKAAKAFLKEQKEGKAKFLAGSTDLEESYKAKIINVSKLIDEEKALKKAVKADSIALHLKTKSTIESLNDEQVNELLHLKWITSLSTELAAMPNAVISQLTSQIQTLADKYSVTYSQVVSNIKSTEQELSEMISELTASEFEEQGLNELISLLKGE